MLTVMYNFTNATDEVMTQRELMKSPAGQDFIRNWTWDGQEMVDNHPRFRKSNTIEDYFYVRIVEADLLLGIGALRIHWNRNNDFMLDTSMQIVICAHDFRYCEDPRKRYDIEYILRSKLYRHLNQKMVGGRCCSDYDPQGCPLPPRPPVPPCPPPCPPGPPKPPCPPCKEPPYYRGYDTRGLDYKNWNYKPCPGEMEPNPPKNGPYGGTYNAYDNRVR